MDTRHGTSAALRRDPNFGPCRRARFICLARPRLEPVWPAPGLEALSGSDCARLLVRVVAAGPAGCPVDRLCADLWPATVGRVSIGRLKHCGTRLAALLGTAASPVLVVGGVSLIDGDALEVDALQLEAALAPLLDAFHPVTAAQVSTARARLGAALAGRSVFLPGCEADWVRAARHRIADSMARAARRLAYEDSVPES